MTSRTQSRAAAAPRPGGTIAPDGAQLGWWSLGDGPGLLVVHGSMQSGRSQLDLGRLLAHGRTVHLLDRRGRGLSGPARPDSSAEVGDVLAAARATGSTDVLGISSGAILTMRAALASPEIERIAVFEPPIVVRGSIRLDGLDRFDREFAEGRLADGMVTAMLVAQMGPGILRFVPRPLLRLGAGRMLRGESVELARALPADLAIVRENAERAGDFASVTAETLLLAGTRTRPYLRTAVDELARAMPGARSVRLPGTDHGVTQNREWRGRPELVAPVVDEFFGH